MSRKDRIYFLIEQNYFIYNRILWTRNSEMEILTTDS
ncbi:hypothetical protein HNP72_003368 [Sphingobacterium soli]|nr:hypothetical protein [Sphingobacterium soli]